jgi:hypothetical protein
VVAKSFPQRRRDAKEAGQLNQNNIAVD